MTSPYLGLRWRTIIHNEDMYIAQVQEQERDTLRWRTLHWIKCLKHEPVGSPDRWMRFLVR